MGERTSELGPRYGWVSIARRSDVKALIVRSAREREIMY